MEQEDCHFVYLRWDWRLSTCEVSSGEELADRTWDKIGVRTPNKWSVRTGSDAGECLIVSIDYLFIADGVAAWRIAPKYELTARNIEAGTDQSLASVSIVLNTRRSRGMQWIEGWILEGRGWPKKSSRLPLRSEHSNFNETKVIVMRREMVWICLESVFYISDPARLHKLAFKISILVDYIHFFLYSYCDGW